MVFHQNHGKLTVVLSDGFADAVHSKGLLQNGVANVFFVGQNALHGISGPFGIAFGIFRASGFQFLLNLRQGIW